MRIPRSFLLLQVVLLAFCSTATAESNLNRNVTVGVNNILNQVSSGVTIGVQIQSMNTGEILYQKNPHHPFMPASNLKLLMAAGALYYLGSNYTYNTSLLTDGSVQNNTLNGNLYVKFTGDPTLTNEDLFQLIAALRAKGIQKINGNLYIDNSLFTGNKYPPGWKGDQLGYCYAAPIGAIIINHNCFNLLLKPTKKGQYAFVKTPETQAMSPPIVNLYKAKTSKKHRRPACRLHLQITNDNKVIMSGCVSKKTYAIGISTPIKNPESFVREVLLNSLAQNNIQLTGATGYSKIYPSFTTLEVHHSATLTDLVSTMLKKSDNIIANSLINTIGANYFHRESNWNDGAIALQNILAQKAKLDMSNANIADGCGLSRYNLVTPSQLSTLLHSVYKSDIAPYFIAALPIAGKDGTLKHRMRRADTREKVRAKTGTINNVSALSGYVETKDHQVLSFVIMINNFSRYHGSLTQIEDRICQYLANVRQ